MTKIIDISGACECWHSGYIDGQAKNDFNNTRNEECKCGNQYDAGFSAAGEIEYELFEVVYWLQELRR